MLSVNSQQNALQGDSKNYTVELTVLTSLFFMWGFLTCLNDILIPHLKAVFDLGYAEAMLVQFVFFIAYFIVSIPSSYILERIGYKGGIVLGLIVAGIGSLLFYPAASFQQYSLFLIALFVLASGITILQVAANPYVAVLGKAETASSRLTLTQAFNSLGTTVAPLFGSMLILSVAIKSAEEIKALTAAELEAYRLLEASAVQVPYLGLAAALFLLAGAMAFFKLPEIKEGENNHSEEAAKMMEDNISIWKFNHLVLGAVAIFVYVGAEVAIGSFLVNFFGEPDIANMSEAQAGNYISFYWGGAMVGRFLGSYILRKIKPGNVLGFNALMASALVIIAMVSNGMIAMWSILLVGLFNSIMFPTIFTLGVNKLGAFTKKGSGILIMAIVGGAIIPLIQGVIADEIGIHHAFILPVICYLYIAYFGFIGSTPKVRN